jgi:hypothetical protein
MTTPAARLYELRLLGLTDARLQDAVMTVLGRWASAATDPIRDQPPGRPDLVLRLSLEDAAAAALLRDLYAAGVSPAGVILRPLHLGVSRDRVAEEAAFAIFIRHGGEFVPTWNWRAFVFGPLWYLKRGLYAKGLVLLGLSVCPFLTLALTVLLSAGILVYCGVAGNWDDYLWRVKGTQWW